MLVFKVSTTCLDHNTELILVIRKLYCMRACVYLQCLLLEFHMSRAVIRQSVSLKFIISSLVSSRIYRTNNSFNYCFDNQFLFHQENISMQYIPPHTPLLYSKTGVCRGIPIFLIFALKHRLWVLVRTASGRRF